jgi:hypothetical protein
MFRSHHIEPRQFMEKTLADLAQLEAILTEVTE